jgi:2'-5' RNA ligase
MHGIVSLLDPFHNHQVEDLWKELESDCGLTGIQVTPIPHFSWQVAYDYNLDLLKPAMEEIARISNPFVARTTGIGLFTGERPVMFISLVKDATLLNFHKLLWDMTKEAAVMPSSFYSPEAWMPHITLAHGDTDWTRITCAMEKLVFQPFNWEILVDNISLINQFEGKVGEEKLHFVFGLDNNAQPKVPPEEHV